MEIHEIFHRLNVDRENVKLFNYLLKQILMDLINTSFRRKEIQQNDTIFPIRYYYPLEEEKRHNRS